jgi:spore maturation protein CgeB
VARLRVLYIGANSGTSRHRALALRRLGHDVSHIDPRAMTPDNRFVGMWTWRTGGLFLEGFLRQRVIRNLPATGFDLVWVDGGDLVGPSLVRELKNRFGTVINYNVDDPFGTRDRRKWRLYLESVALYDLVVVVRECNVIEAYAKGARDVLHVYRSADEIAHSPRRLAVVESQQWASDVAFIGTWMPERGPFLATLIRLGVPLTIHGDRWHKAKEWKVLCPYWCGPGLRSDDDYAAAVQGAKICLGLVSKGNRDLSTQRSFEIPHLGGVLCAERTTEHSQLYKDNEEAVFWSTPEECTSKCMKLLHDEPYRQLLGINGRNRCLKNGTTNEVVLAKILQRALRLSQTQIDPVEPQACGYSVLVPEPAEGHRI